MTVIHSNSHVNYSSTSFIPPKKRIRYSEKSEIPNTVNHLAVELIKNRNEQGSTISQPIVSKSQSLTINKNNQQVTQSTEKLLEKTVKNEEFNSVEEISEREKTILDIKWIDQLNEGYDLLDSSQSIACLKYGVNDIFQSFIKFFFLESREIKACQLNYDSFYKVFLNIFPELKETKNFKDLEIPLLFLAIKFACHIDATDLIPFLLTFDKKDEKKIYSFFHEVEDWLSEILNLQDEEDQLRISLLTLNLGKEIFNKEISYLEIKELFDKTYGSWVAACNETPKSKKELEIFNDKSFCSAGLPELKELHRVANRYVENILKMENYSELSKKPYLDNLQIAALFLAFKFFSEEISLGDYLFSLDLSNEQQSLLTLEHYKKSEAWLLKALDWKVDVFTNQSVS